MFLWRAPYGDAAVSQDHQGVLKALRQRLLDAGVTASEITFPEYLPNGECRVVDPDGYVLMIAQAAADTP